MFKQLLSVFLESHCPFCDRVAYSQGLHFYPRRRTKGCNRTTAKTICEYCFNRLLSHQLKKRDRLGWRGNLPLFAWGRYEGQLKRAIALMKYNNHPEIGIILGQLLAQDWLESSLIRSRKVSVIPIPLHRSKMKERGFNQATKIAQGFCQLTGYSLDERSLIRAKETKAMFNLSPEARTNNLQGAFKLGPKLPKHPVLLLDDIYTMGTTVRESAQVLRSYKIEVIGSIVVAKAIVQ